METNKKIHRHIKIIYFNANGLNRQKQAFQKFIEDHQIDVALINETFLKPHITFRLANYNVIRNDRLDQQNGGTAIVIKRSIPFTEIDRIVLNSIEVTGINLYTTDSPIALFSCYKSPPVTLLKADLELLKRNHKRIVLAGDLNAKNKLWNSRVFNRSGRRLEAFADELNLHVIAPTTPTFYPYNGSEPDVLDTCVYANVQILNHPVSICDLDSDHVPVFFELNHKYSTSYSAPPLNAKTNWNLYKKHIQDELDLMQDPTSLQEAETAISKITNLLQSEYKKHTSHIADPEKDEENGILIHFLTRIKRNIRKRWQNTRNPAFRRLFNWISNKIKTRILQIKIKKWSSTIQDSATNPAKLWKIIKNMQRVRNQPRTTPIAGPNGLIFDDLEKSQIFADHLAQQFSINRNLNDLATSQAVHHSLVQLEELHKPELDHKISSEEISKLIQSLSNNKAAGDDFITSIMLKHTPTNLHSSLAIAFQIFLNHNYFPARWKNAIVILIPKANKDSKILCNHRPISLLSHIGKLYEKLIMKLLSQEADNLQAIPNHQFGFRKGLDTQIQLLRLVDHITAGFNDRKFTLTAFLDVQGAFDKVWKHGLIHKMLSAGFSPSLVQIIRNFLENRSFQVKIGRCITNRSPMSAGVPQGSPLSPILYSIYTSDIPITPGADIATYADDTAIFTSHRNFNYAVRHLNRALSAFENWSRIWKIGINVNKSTIVSFSKRPIPQIPDFHLNNEIIQTKHAAKYLGITLDRRLTFKQHIFNIKKKNYAKIGFLFPILKSPKLPLQIKIQVYKTIIRSSFSYAAPVFRHAAKTNIPPTDNTEQMFENNNRF